VTILKSSGEVAYDCFVSDDLGQATAHYVILCRQRSCITHAFEMGA